MGNTEADKESKINGSNAIFKAAPMERLKYTQAGNKPDPYVVRARERAQNKLKDRMYQMNGGHIH